MSFDEEYEKLLEQRIAEREERRKGLSKEQSMLNSNFKQPVYAHFCQTIHQHINKVSFH